MTVRTGPIRVLLVEDNPGDARLILETLREVDGELFELESVDRLGRAADRLAGAGIDVVLLDLGLPDSQGIETFERAQRLTRDEPIVVISGHDDERMALEAVRSGAQDYLVKGRIEGDLLARVIRYAIERKQAERERREAAERINWLSVAVEQSPGVVIIVDLDGRVAYVNALFVERTGYPAEEAVGRPLESVLSVETPGEVADGLWDTVRAGETWTGDVRSVRRDGTAWWAEVRASPVRDEGGALARVLVLAEDVTERRGMVQALRERDEQFRQVTETINEVYFLTAADFSEVHFVSPAYERVWGRTLESMYRDPASFLEAVVEEDRSVLIDDIARLRDGGEPRKVEFRIRRPDGDVRTILVESGGVRDDRGDVYRLAGVALDITARREAEQAVAASERRLRTLFETVNLIVLGLDLEGRIEYVNPFLEELTGHPGGDLVGRDFFERLVPGDRRVELEGIFRELVAEGRHLHHAGPIVTREGHRREIAWHHSIVRDPGGRPIGTLSVGEDVTERMSLEEQLRQSQKMEAVGRLAGGIAHDFNNLLTAIIGPAELLLYDLAEDDPARADVVDIRSAAQRAAGLTSQLLAFSRRQVLEPRLLDLNVLLADADRLLRRIIGEDVQLRLVPGTDLAPVRADPGRIEQVVFNLAVNARDAMPEGGLLTIETANVELDEFQAAERVEVEPGEYVMVAITDTGTGILPEVRARMFEPFFTTKAQGKGTGLGLASVHGIVKQSGGHLWVYSEPGRGTTFKIYLPRADGAERRDRGPRAEPVDLSGTETILLVEDEDVVRAATRKMLESRGYRVIPAASGEEALAALQAGGDAPSLLLTDVVMPRMSGRELADAVSGLLPGIRVLYVSGYTDETIVSHGVLEEGLHFLQKPFTPDGLARAVRRALHDGD